MKKRILSLLLLSTLVLSLVPLTSITAFAADDLIWPVDSSYYITCMYYYKTGGKHSTRYDYRNGMDIAGGGNILAVESGTVETATNLGSTSFGKYVVIKHASGYRSLYAHLASYNVSVGQTVTKGQKIGVMGTTGNSSGVHLHFEYSGGDPWKLFYDAKYRSKISFEQNVRSNNATYNSDKTIVNVIDQYYYKSGTNYYYDTSNTHTCSFSGSYYESAHPHNEYQKCSCGITRYTGATGSMPDSCSICDFASDNGIANGKSYKISGNGVGFSGYTANLTDAAASENLSYDNNWFAFYYKSDASSEVINAPDGKGSVTIDLGGYYDLTKVKMNLANNVTSGLPAPKAINIYSSADGANYSKVGAVDNISTEENVAYIGKADISGIARFVKVEFELGGMFAFVNEIKVFGTETAYVPDPDTGVNIALNKDYVISGNGIGHDTYTANLTDGNAQIKLTYDNNWFAFYYNQSSDASAVNAPNGKGSVTIDLGRFYDLSEVKINMINQVESGIVAPKAIKIYISENGTDFTEAASVATINTIEDIAYVSKANVSGVARYVKVEFELAGTFVFLNEVKVFGVESDYTPVTPDPVKLGDVNADGSIDSIDYLCVKRAVLKTYSLSDSEKTAADIDTNGSIDSVDYMLVKRMALGTYVS